MSNIQYSVGFYGLCRVCTTNSEKKINIFSSEGKRNNLCAKIIECLSLKIEEKDCLPKVLCARCMELIENIVDLRNTCKNSQITLSQYLKRASQQKGKVFIVDTVSSNDESVVELGDNVGIGVGNCSEVASIAPEKKFVSTFIQTRQFEINELQQKKLLPYTITVDNKGTRLTEPVEFKLNNVHPIDKTTTKPRVTLQKRNTSKITEKHNPLEELLKSKPDLKVTHLARGVAQRLSERSLQTTSQSIPPHLQKEQAAIIRLQMQQSQQQLQNQQWQQQLHQINSQLQKQQPQQMTITVPNGCPTDTLSSRKSKKQKMNFVLAPPTTAIPNSATFEAVLPQLTAQSQIRLQLQTTPTTQQQQQSSGIFLTNLLQQQQLPQLPSPQRKTSAKALLSPSKCFLPISITDENSEKQIVAHIDTKSNLFMPTYQLQMKLQPQIAAVDGQSIMQLAPSMPSSTMATLEITPQTLTTSTKPVSQKQFLQEMQQTLQQKLPTNIQITSKQIVTSPSNTNKRSIANICFSRNGTNDAPTPINNQNQDILPANYNILKLQETQHDVQKKYIIHKSNLNILPTSKITQVTDRQPQQIKFEKHTSVKNMITTTVPTQHDGVAVHCVTTKSIANKLHQQNLKNTPKALSELTVLNKKNDRITSVQQQKHLNKQLQRQIDTKQHVSKKLEVQHQKQSAEKVSKKTTTLNSKTTQYSQHKQQQKTPEEPPVIIPHGVGLNGLECSQCKKIFKKREHLTQHIKLHAGYRPYQCTITDCGKKFSRKEHLQRHQISHSGTKSYKCETCEKLFSRKDNLSKHRRIHTEQANVSNYICECSKTFAVERYYLEHKALQHGGDATVGKTNKSEEARNKFQSQSPPKKMEQQIVKAQQQFQQQFKTNYFQSEEARNKFQSQSPPKKMEQQIVKAQQQFQQQFKTTRMQQEIV